MKTLFTIEIPGEKFRPRSGVRPTKLIVDKRTKNKNFRKAKHKKKDLD